MTQVYVKAPAPSAAEAKARIDAWLNEPDVRTRTPLHGIPPEFASAPVLAALSAEGGISADRMNLLATAANAFRVHKAPPLFLEHARAEHATFDGYRARIAALYGAAMAARSPTEVLEAGESLLFTLLDDPAAAQVLPELLNAFVAYELDFEPLERRLQEIIARLDNAEYTDDSKRLQARGVEEFSLNDVPRARRAISAIKEMRTIESEAVRLDILTAIHVGEDLRFRKHLWPFAIRLLQETALAEQKAAVAAAFLRAYDRADEKEAEVRRVRQAIAAQAAAWFGAEIDDTAAEAAAMMPLPDAGLFGTELVPLIR